MPHRPKSTMPALSIRQPFAEQILLGLKRIEYRSKSTTRRGRVYIYASRIPHPDPQEWRKIDKLPAQLPAGRIVGTVEITDCTWSDESRCYCWHLKSPQRLPPRRPDGRPQPVWFYPFTQDSPPPMPPAIPMEQTWLPFDPPARR
ncbi:MAG: ASCH domain-containing protein [Bacillota bacterium]